MGKFEDLLIRHLPGLAVGFMIGVILMMLIWAGLQYPSTTLAVMDKCMAEASMTYHQCKYLMLNP